MCHLRYQRIVQPLSVLLLVSRSLVPQVSVSGAKEPYVRMVDVLVDKVFNSPQRPRGERFRRRQVECYAEPEVRSC